MGEASKSQWMTWGKSQMTEIKMKMTNLKWKVHFQGQCNYFILLGFHRRLHLILLLHCMKKVGISGLRIMFLWVAKILDRNFFGIQNPPFFPHQCVCQIKTKVKPSQFIKYRSKAGHESLKLICVKGNTNMSHRGEASANLLLDKIGSHPAKTADISVICISFKKNLLGIECFWNSRNRK